jgi:hypothetical protein
MFTLFLEFTLVKQRVGKTLLFVATCFFFNSLIVSSAYAQSCFTFDISLGQCAQSEIICEEDSLTNQVNYGDSIANLCEAMKLRIKEAQSSCVGVNVDTKNIADENAKLLKDRTVFSKSILKLYERDSARRTRFGIEKVTSSIEQGNFNEVTRLIRTLNSQLKKAESGRRR